MIHGLEYLPAEEANIAGQSKPQALQRKIPLAFQASPTGPEVVARPDLGGVTQEDHSVIQTRIDSGFLCF